MAKIRVLVADDQPIVRRGVDLLLREEPDFEVVGQAGDGLETVEAVRRLRPDVVLMDVMMPGLSGLDATRRIKESNPDVSVLMLTVHDREEYLSDSLRAGAQGYLLKEASVEELIGAIRTVHSGEVFIQPRMTTKLVGEYLNHSGNSRDGDSYRKLSAREREVLPLLAESHTNQEVADHLHLSPYTVQTYRQRIMRKLDLHSRTDLMKYALRKKLITIDA
jgi:two-component system response regulator NreC